VTSLIELCMLLHRFLKIVQFFMSWDAGISLCQQENWIMKLTKITRTRTQPYHSFLQLATWILFFNSAPLRSISSVTWSINIAFLIAPIQVHLSLPLVLIGPISYDLSLFLISTLIYLCCACPNHLDQFSITLFSTGVTANVLLRYSFLILSLSVLLFIHLSFIISTTIIFCKCFLLTQQSEP